MAPATRRTPPATSTSADPLTAAPRAPHPFPGYGARRLSGAVPDCWYLRRRNPAPPLLLGHAGALQPCPAGLLRRAIYLRVIFMPLRYIASRVYRPRRNRPGPTPARTEPGPAPRPGGMPRPAIPPHPRSRAAQTAPPPRPRPLVRAGWVLDSRPCPPARPTARRRGQRITRAAARASEAGSGHGRRGGVAAALPGAWVRGRRGPVPARRRRGRFPAGGAAPPEARPSPPAGRPRRSPRSPRAAARRRSPRRRAGRRRRCRR